MRLAQSYSARAHEFNLFKTQRTCKIRVQDRTRIMHVRCLFEVFRCIQHVLTTERKREVNFPISKNFKIKEEQIEGTTAKTSVDRITKDTLTLTIAGSY